MEGVDSSHTWHRLSWHSWYAEYGGPVRNCIPIIVATDAPGMHGMQCVEAHGGKDHQLQPKDFQMTVIRKHPTNLSRQVEEGTLISAQLLHRDMERKQGKANPRRILNSRTEWNQPGLVKPRAAKIMY